MTGARTNLEARRALSATGIFVSEWPDAKTAKLVILLVTPRERQHQLVIPLAKETYILYL
jgi:hypothetical protein